GGRLAPEEKLDKTTRGMAHLLRAFCSELLGDVEAASRDYDRSVALGYHLAYTARGLFRYEDDPGRATADLRRAIELKTPVLWPYYLLALRAVEGEDDVECIRLGRLGIQAAGPDQARDDLRTWVRFAEARQAARAVGAAPPTPAPAIPVHFDL